MSRRDDLVKVARGYKGITESPRGSNCNQFSKRRGRPCERWCGDFADCCYLDVGVDLTKVLTPTPQSCAAILAAARKKGWVIRSSQAKRGDLALFQFDHDAAPDHVEIIVEDYDPKNPGSVLCVGGNTGAGYQANGGMVHEQRRPFSKMLGIVRVPDLDEPGVPQPPFVPVPDRPQPRPLPASEGDPMVFVLKYPKAPTEYWLEVGSMTVGGKVLPRCAINLNQGKGDHTDLMAMVPSKELGTEQLCNQFKTFSNEVTFEEAFGTPGR